INSNANHSQSLTKSWVELESCTLQKKSLCRKLVKLPELEENVVDWRAQVRPQGTAVSTTELRARDLHITDFRASENWTSSFPRRHQLSICRRTHISQRLRDNYEYKLLEFQSIIIKQRKFHYCELIHIGNTDQTLITFDMLY
ncbi:hypothetical protein LSH36_178g06106, partial [Paralvinella palmiformis]